MKRLIAKRKSTKRCICCNKPIISGDVYYHERKVFKDFDDDKIHGVTYYFCARCNYETTRKKERYERFVSSNKCKHPIVHTVYGLIWGEDYAQEPKYDECRICGKRGVSRGTVRT